MGIAGHSKRAVAVPKPRQGGCVRVMQASRRGSAGSIIIVLCMLAPIPRTASQQVQCHTTDGDLIFRLHKEWAPEGYARFLSLVASDFFNGQAVFNVDRGNVVNFGIARKVAGQKQYQTIRDDPDVGIGHSTGLPLTKRGYLYFNAPRPTSRSTQMVIADRDGKHMGPYERPIGILTNPDALDQLYDGYGDTQALAGQLLTDGDRALRDYPKLSTIYFCETKYTDLEEAVHHAKARSAIGDQLKDVRLRTIQTRDSMFEEVKAKILKSTINPEAPVPEEKPENEYMAEQVFRCV